MKKILISVLFSATAIIVYSQSVNFGPLSGLNGNYNSSFGYGAGFSVIGEANTFIGHNSGMYTTTGSQNTFVGFKSGYSNTTAVQNHFIGFQSGFANTGYWNHFDGYNSGYSNSTGSENQFIGHSSGYSNTTGGMNLFIGYQAGRENTTASNNLFIGNRAGSKNTIGNNNFFTGFQAGYNNTVGSNNSYLGFRAGFSNVAGSGNVFLGNYAGYSETGSNKLYIDNSDTSTPLIYGDFASDVLTVNGSLGLGTPSPGGKLDINYAGAQLKLSGGSVAGGIWTDAGDVLYVADWNTGSKGLKINMSSGNIGIGASPLYKLQVQNAYCDGNTWYNVSDKNLKENFARIKNESILDKVMELPIQYWNYKTDKMNRHIGPTAQDFYKVFALGTNEKAISTIDESGVALAAIQELNRKTEELVQIVKEQQQLIASLLQAKVESAGKDIRTNETGLKLFQNQPNPFQRDTKITMEIPQEVNKAVLYIYDLQGKAIEQQMIPGRGATSVLIEGGKLSAGIYLYTLIGDGKATEVKKMILTD